MSMQRTWSILAAGFLAAGCMCAPNRSEAVHPGEGQTPATDEPNAFPAEEHAPVSDFAPAPSAPASVPEGSNYEFHDESGVPAAAPPPAPEARSDGPRDLRSYEESAHASRGSGAPAKKSAQPLEFEPERPGLGTTWGETRTSRVSNSPFERASSNPFSLTSVHYNDSSGVAAMLHGASPVAYRTDAAIVSNGAVTVRLVDANGSPLPTFNTSKGALVQGDVGDRYMIELVNETSSRFEAVVTVDGLDVMDGRPGSFAKRGYLLQPFATLDIDGFRQSMDEVAAFRFGSVRGSYAAQKGNDRNVGVVGVALFSERGASGPWSERELRRRETADPFPGRFATPPSAR